MTTRVSIVHIGWSVVNATVADPRAAHFRRSDKLYIVITACVSFRCLTGHGLTVYGWEGPLKTVHIGVKLRDESRRRTPTVDSGLMHDAS